MLRSLTLVLAVLLSLRLNELTAAESVPLVLQLSSGRQFSGELDPATTSETLVLRSQSGGMTIRRPIQWDRIESAALGSRSVGLDELRMLAAELTTRDGGPEVWPPIQETEVVTQATVEQPLPVAVSRVTTLSFEARIANWDSDVEMDGLLIDLQPLDREGYLAPASGTAQIELFAMQRRVFQHAPLSGGDTVELLERWTRPIRAADFTANGIRLRLPFGAIHPEFRSDWLANPFGLVHVRLMAPGHGTFDASDDPIRIRPWAPTRDQLELHDRPRFLPTEAVGRQN